MKEGSDIRKALKSAIVETLSTGAEDGELAVGEMPNVYAHTQPKYIT